MKKTVINEKNYVSPVPTYYADIYLELCNPTPTQTFALLD